MVIIILKLKLNILSHKIQNCDECVGSAEGVKNVMPHPRLTTPSSSPFQVKHWGPHITPEPSVFQRCPHTLTEQATHQSLSPIVCFLWGNRRVFFFFSLVIFKVPIFESMTVNQEIFRE